MVDVKLIIIGIILIAIGSIIEGVSTVFEETARAVAQIIGIFPIIGGLVIFVSGIKE